MARRTVLECVCQRMILFTAGRREALKCFLAHEGTASHTRTGRLPLLAPTGVPEAPQAATAMFVGTR